jgi:hypothetical protein
VRHHQLPLQIIDRNTLIASEPLPTASFKAGSSNQAFLIPCSALAWLRLVFSRRRLETRGGSRSELSSYNGFFSQPEHHNNRNSSFMYRGYTTVFQIYLFIYLSIDRFCQIAFATDQALGTSLCRGRKKAR